MQHLVDGVVITIVMNMEMSWVLESNFWVPASSLPFIMSKLPTLTFSSSRTLSHEVTGATNHKNVIQ